MSPDQLEKLKQRNILWITEVGKSGWLSNVDGIRLRLVMNDFPEEPLWTLSFDGYSVDL